MKKAISIILILLFCAGAALSFYLYWNNLRGAGPALLPPSENIAEILETFDLTDDEFPFDLPSGFTASVFADDLGNARNMTWSPSGELLVSITDQGKVVALPNRDSDGRADEVITVVEGLNKPHGITTRCREKCELYIAESDQIAVYDYDEVNLKAINKRKIIDLPDGGNHFTRSIMFMPYPNEDKLLISVGSSCNACEEKDWRRAKILSADFDGTDLKTFASGLRNSVFMAIHPVNGEIWATEMGRDLLGDNIPPDEINIIKEGGDYGWPICYGNNIHDSSFDKNVYVRDPCADKTAPHIEIPAHSAPLGMAFFPEEGWPQEYWHNLLVAYHGSWNKTEPTGYKIVRYKLDENGKVLGVEDFATGWLKDGEALGRPVDIIIQPGGKIYVSDDKAGIIYSINYTPQNKPEDKSNLIRVDSIDQGDEVSSPLTITGKARGTWYFEASFPVRVYDQNDVELAVGIAQAQSDWMTEDFVEFKVELVFEAPKTKTGWIVFEKDNPSGLPEFSDELKIPVIFK